MEIGITGLNKSFYSEGKTIKALDRITSDHPANRIFTLLGPSGAQDDALHRRFGLPDNGRSGSGIEVVFSAERESMSRRTGGTGDGFSTYAIWPHMNVFDNVAIHSEHNERENHPQGRKTLHLCSSTG